MNASLENSVSFFLINPCPANQIDVISIPANQVDVISKAKVVFLNLALHRLFQYNSN